jgi:hypothetical protein
VAEHLLAEGVGGEQTGHPLGPFGEHLVGVVAGGGHDGDHLSDEGAGHPGVEQIGHGADEDPPWRAPAQWLAQDLGVEGDPVAGPGGGWPAVGLVVGLAHGLEPPGQGEGVAVLTARRDPVAAGDRVPGGLGPFDR